MLARKLRAAGLVEDPPTYVATYSTGSTTANGSTFSPSNTASWSAGDTLVIFAAGRVANSTAWRPHSMSLSHSTSGDTYTRQASGMTNEGTQAFEPWVVCWTTTCSSSNSATGTWTVTDGSTGSWANIALTVVRFSGGVSSIEAFNADDNTNVSPTIPTDSLVVAGMSAKQTASTSTWTGSTTLVATTSNENTDYGVKYHPATETSPFTWTVSTQAHFAGVVLKP